METEKSKSFEELIENLEEIVTSLDKGGLSLDEASVMYEKGMKLASEATKILESTELKIKNIKDEYEVSEVSENIDE
ncbi:MAG: exodeoxyribonuclease VII small subunit [Dehalococcoidia bacterium]|tara:strand:- start:84 stop:314 length:231 start_codon:yes stop_codon:yes gene_type:complete